MGGSGGSFYSKPKKLAQEVQESIDEFFEEHLEADVSSFLSETLANANNRDIEAVSKHIDEIKKALEKDLEDSINILFGGSVAKHTFVDGLSDVDTLLVINDTELKDKTPSSIKSYMVEKLKERFPSTEITQGKLAVTVKFGDYDIQIIPAIRHGDKIVIPNKSGKEWSEKIHPKAFTQKLTELNKKYNYKVIPVIKLVKSIIYSYPEQKQLSGYHIESMALEIFNDYSGKLTPPRMLKYFFEKAPSFVLKPMKDSTGQSGHLDDYLKGENSLERELAADALKNTARKMTIARSIEQWKQFFE